MMMDDSSVLGMAFGSAGVTKVLMCVATNCSRHRSFQAAFSFKSG